MISRKEFLKLVGHGLGAIGIYPLMHIFPNWMDNKFVHPRMRARVTTQKIHIYCEPDFNSERIGNTRRDQLLWLFEEIRSTSGPGYNPRWYRLTKGFVHSGYLQRVENWHMNPVVNSIPVDGQLGEITVPYVHSVRKTRSIGWINHYRLYYQSVHWISSIDEGPDGKPWYGLTNDRLRLKYYVPARCIRLIQPEELSPISTDVPDDEKHIQVSLEDQEIIAFEGDHPVFRRKVSTGIPSKGVTHNGIPTDTPQGHFRIQVKAPSRHMGDGQLTSDPEAYELPGVPWVSYFHFLGIAFHGTYWHDNFGRMMSHGCINMRNEDAQWLFRWSQPTARPQEWRCKGSGTRVRIV